jgi:NDP-sugar pyrophosphorylase family protein
VSELVGLIPAAGRGVRAYPYTKRIPKGLFKVSGKPLLEHLVTLQRDQLGIQRIFIVVGELGDAIKKYFEDGSNWGIRIEYLENDAVHLGLAYSVSLGEQVVNEPFLLMLSDEYYQDTNHARLAGINLDSALGYCALMKEQDWSRISKNFTVHLQENCITHLMEKPRERVGDLLGTGTFLLSPRIFGYLKEAVAQTKDATDFIGVLDEAVQNGEILHPFYLKGKYVNINDLDSLNWANFLGRSRADSHQLP